MCAPAAFLRSGSRFHGAFARFVAISDQLFIMSHHEHNRRRKGSVVRACACCVVLCCCAVRSVVVYVLCVVVWTPIKCIMG